MEFGTIALPVITVAISYIALMLFGPLPVFRGTIIEQIYIAFVLKVPRTIGHKIRAAAGPILSRYILRGLNKLFYRANPSVLVVFVVLYTGCMYLFIYHTLDLFRAAQISIYTKIFVWAQIFINLSLYVYTCVSDPGTITPQNHKYAITMFDYDHLIFFPGKCKTCKFTKPARSKHCSMCDRCVSLFDHHCVWFNNCIGLNNYWSFLSFLWSIFFLCFSGSMIVFYALVKASQANHTFQHSIKFTYLKPNSTLPVKDMITILLQSNALASSLAVFLLFLSPILLFFFGLQLKLLMSGTTTNESEKWGQIYDAVEDQVLYIVYSNDQDAEYSHSNSSVNPKLGSPGHLEIIEDDRKKKDSRYKILVESNDQLTNVYDLGALNNLKLAFFPPTLTRPP